MNFSSIPYKFSVPWGSSATAGYITTSVPVNAIGGAAGQNLGFPPITAANIAAGGIPPNIADFNGLGFYLTAWAQWQQAGGPTPYDSTFAANISGYPNGAVIPSSVVGRYWLNTADGNTSNPDTGGAGWIPLHHQPTRWYVYSSNQTVYPIGPNVDFVLIAGGGSGGGTGGVSNQYPGGGGGGGEIAVGSITGLVTGVSALTLVVGAGGSGASGNGSLTSITAPGVTISVNPGLGGATGVIGGAAGGAGGFTGSSSYPAVFSGSNYTGYRAPGAPGDTHLSIATYYSSVGIASGRGGANGLGQPGPFYLGPGSGGSGTYPGTGGSGGFTVGSVGYGASGVILLKM